MGRKQTKIDRTKVPPKGKTPKPTRKTDRRKSWSAYIDDADRYGFFKLKNTTLRTMEEGQYEQIIEDDTRWQSLRERMDADFTHSLEMFPFSERLDDKSQNIQNWIERYTAHISNLLMWCLRAFRLTAISLPQRYYAITRLNIEDRFPGGRASGDPGDGDIRDMLAAFRQSFRENLAFYILKKRQYQFAVTVCFALASASLLFFFNNINALLTQLVTVPFQNQLTQGHVIDMSPVTPLLVAALIIGFYRFGHWFYIRESRNLFDFYNNSQTESCKTLDKQAALRTKNLKNLITTMAARLGKDSTSVLKGGAARSEETNSRWPELAYRWTLLIYWLGRRMENVERYTQLQIWLVRRTHYFYRIVATTSNHVVTGLVMCVIALCGAAVAGRLIFSRVDVQGVIDTIVAPAWAWVAAVVADIAQRMGLGHWRLPELSLHVASPLAKTSVLPDIHSILAYLSGRGIYDNTMLGLYLLCCLFALVLAVRFNLKVSRLSTDEWNTSLELIQQNLDVANWDRFHSVNLHHLLADQVRNDKKVILRREDWVQR